MERVHLMACKKMLGVSIRAPNDAVYGELGRHPLYITSAARCITYWIRLLKQPNTVTLGCPMIYASADAQ